MKKIILFIELIVIIILIGVVIVVFVPGAKNKLFGSFLGCSIGQGIAGLIVGDDYEEYIQDKDFDESSILVNEGLEIPEEYTNVLLLGGDANKGFTNGSLGEGAHSDSIIILSINNNTGEMKMVSVYRDTYLQYTVNDINYGKATSALFFGGIPSAVNMVNKNLDLNIKDYVVINYNGLANIIDSIGGLEVEITEQEMKYINFHLVDTRNKTGKETPDVETYGQVTLTGLQAVSYCRVRQTSFTDQSGEVYNDDYGRTERQKYILKLTLKKMKQAGAGELLGISKDLFKENTPEDKFITTSMNLNEALDILSVAMELNLESTSGFPTERTSRNMNVGSSIIPNDLEYNVSILHEYLFGTVDYVPTDDVYEISEIIKDKSGVR